MIFLGSLTAFNYTIGKLFPLHNSQRDKILKFFKVYKIPHKFLFNKFVSGIAYDFRGIFRIE